MSTFCSLKQMETNTRTRVQIDRAKCLDEIEGVEWPEPDWDSRLVSQVPIPYWFEHPDRFQSFRNIPRSAIELLRSEELIARGDWQVIAQLESAISNQIEGGSQP